MLKWTMGLAVGLVVGGAALLIDPVATLDKRGFSASEADARGRRGGISRREARGISRRTSRRVNRRINRRHHYYRALPVGCVRIVLGGVRYWDCGGIYYQSIVESGKTVYIIVTP